MTGPTGYVIVSHFLTLLIVASIGDGLLYTQHDVHQNEHWHLSSTSLCSKGLQLDHLR